MTSQQLSANRSCWYNCEFAGNNHRADYHQTLCFVQHSSHRYMHESHLLTHLKLSCNRCQPVILPEIVTARGDTLPLTMRTAAICQIRAFHIRIWVFRRINATLVGTEAHFPIAGTETRSPIAWKSEHTPTRVHQLPSDFAAIVHHAFSTPAVRSVQKLQTLSGCCKAWSPYCVLEHAFLVRTAWLQRTRKMQSC